MTLEHAHFQPPEPAVSPAGKTLPAGGSGSAVHARHLVKEFPGTRFWRSRAPKRALDGIDLDLAFGEVLAVVGPNGAGKTTLLRLLSGMLIPTSGWATVAGYPLTEARQVKSVVGLASGDDRGFYGRLSGRQNLLFFGALRGLRGAGLAARVAEALTQFELGEVGERSTQKLSTGERQRLSLARATLHGPRVLLLDEPTRGLDPMMTERVEEWLRRWLTGSEGRAAMLVSHDLDQIERISDRAAILLAGRLAVIGPLSEFGDEHRHGASLRLRERLLHLTREDNV